ncbi:hypothetical protein MQE36_00445 [Zhouia spongiae]|uniref:Uncharacterized protein n=1 Tax=Zhouia spongiae TaxID=2202721 RepID=A0ABY3YM26_9FLAO|nr:hypothetical protein [Zhouia spongiae]UNY98839.1 hypothetical protein MQE36_00445 [Zhouia spongiae]
MTAPCKYTSEPYTKVYYSDDRTTSVLDLPGGKVLNGDFKYMKIGLQVLSGTLVNATGISVPDFATENLFLPLDIEPPEN